MNVSDYPDFEWYEALVYDCPVEGCPFYVLGAWIDIAEDDESNPSLQAMRSHWDEAHRAGPPA